MNITYVYQLSIAPNYKWDNKGICYNDKTGRIIKQVLNNGCIGYNIKGKFISLTKLRALLEKPKITDDLLKELYPNMF